MQTKIAALLFAWGILFLEGCSSHPVSISSISPQKLFEEACSPGKTVQSVKGEVWTKVSSPEVSGQFPASVLVDSSDHFEMEVTNLLGGTEGFIQGTKGKYEVSSNRKGEDKRSLDQVTWSGIPLRWASELFLGRIPCPAENQDLRISSNDVDELRIEVKTGPLERGQLFVFKFKSLGKKLWPSQLHWEETEFRSVFVDFKFDQPEEKTLSPTKWEAKSSRGSIKVRWRHRNVISFKHD